MYFKYFPGKWVKLEYSVTSQIVALQALRGHSKERMPFLGMDTLQKKKGYIMKKLVMVVCIALLSVGFTAQASDALLEQVMLLRIVNDLGVDDYEMVEILNGYKEYRSAVDALTDKIAGKSAELQSAIDAGESASRISALTRELMALDLDLLRTKQGAVNEAADVLDAASVGQLYLVVRDMDAAKDSLLAELTGKAGAVCPVTGMACPTTAAPEQSLEEELMELGKFFLDKLIEKDFDGAFAGVADDFQHYLYEIRNKEQLRNYMESASAAGFLDDVKINFDDVEIKVDGDKVVAYPVDVSGIFGRGTLELIAEKRNGKYLLTSMDVFGL